MSELTYFTYPGVGERHLSLLNYTQAVRIGDRIECAGQGGWDPTTGVISDDLSTQIEQTFANIDLNLKHAGGKGWSQVYRVKSYHLPLDDEALEIMVRNLRKWLPGHQPIWTGMGAASMGLKGMRVEIEVVAYVGEKDA